MLKIGDMALVFGLLTLGAITVTYVLVALQWRSVQGRIPRQFDFLGRPRGWSGKWILWFNPSFALVFAAGTTLVVKVTQGDAYAEVAEGVAAACALIAILMLVVTKRSVAIARKRATGLGWIFLPCLAIAIALLVWHYS